MGTTIDDILYEEASLEYQRDLDLQAITDHLPIRKNVLESEYIEHLLDAYYSLINMVSPGQPFAIMPFHLIYMLSIQYKVLRICRDHSLSMDLFFSGVGGRDKQKLLNVQKSVFDIGVINERTIPEVFRLVDADGQIIKKVKELVDYRNENLGHAKGGITSNPQDKIDQYLSSLNEIQKLLILLNDGIAEEWISELTDEDNLDDFIESKLVDSYLCQSDFSNGKLLLLAILTSETNITFKEIKDIPLPIWSATMKLGLKVLHSRTLEKLNTTAKNDSDPDRKRVAILLLSHNNKLARSR